MQTFVFFITAPLESVYKILRLGAYEENDFKNISSSSEVNSCTSEHNKWEKSSEHSLQCTFCSIDLRACEYMVFMGGVGVGVGEAGLFWLKLLVPDRLKSFGLNKASLIQRFIKSFCLNRIILLLKLLLSVPYLYNSLVSSVSQYLKGKLKTSLYWKLY